MKAKRVRRKVITESEMTRRIMELAYIFAEQRNFENGSPEEDWIKAETEIKKNFRLKRSGKFIGMRVI